MNLVNDSLEKHTMGADVVFVQLPLPIFEKELKSEERNMHTTYWNKLTNLVPKSYFSPDRPILNFMEIGLGLPTLSGQIKEAGLTPSLINLIGFSGSSPNYKAIKEIIAEAGESPIFMLSPMTCGYSIFSQIATLIKDLYPNTNIIAGGPHVSKLPIATLQSEPSVDIVTTDKKFTIGDLLDTIIRKSKLSEVPGIVYRTNGRIVHSPATLEERVYEDNGNLAHLDLSILPSSYSKFSWARIYTSLGCAYACAYCADILHSRKKPKPYNIDLVMKNIDCLKEKFGVTLFYIGDETFTYNLEHAKEFAKRMGTRKDTYWIAQTRVDCVNKETLSVLAENNCILLKFGAESGSNKILRAMRKGITTKQIIEATKIAKEVGLNVFTYWMTGLPGETKETIQQSMDLQRKLFELGYCDLAEDVIFVPYPGTYIYQNPDEYGVTIEPKPWAQWREDMPSVTSTHTLSSQQIYDLWLKKIDNLARLIKSR